MCENLITVKIKLPDKNIIDIKTSPDATFKKFLEAALTQYPKIKEFGYVKFEYKCNIWDIDKFWVQAQDRLQQKQTLVFNKSTLEEKKVTMSIGKYLFIKDNAELSLIPAEDDPCAINLNNLEETDIRENKLPINMEVAEYSNTDFCVYTKQKYTKPNNTNVYTKPNDINVYTKPNDTFEAFIRKACFLNLYELSKFSRVKFILEDENKNKKTTLKRSDMKKTVDELCGGHIKSGDKGKKYCKIWIKVYSSKDKDDEYTVNLDDFRNTKKVDEKADSKLIDLELINEDLHSEQKKNDSNEKIVINNASPKKINWPRIIVGILTLFLLAATIVLFLLFFLLSLNISLTAPIISAVVSFVCFTIWSLWNNIVPKNFEGGIIYKSLSENDIDVEKEKLNTLTNPQQYSKQENDFNLE